LYISKSKGYRFNFKREYVLAFLILVGATRALPISEGSEIFHGDAGLDQKSMMGKYQICHVREVKCRSFEKGMRRNLQRVPHVV